MDKFWQALARGAKGESTPNSAWIEICTEVGRDAEATEKLRSLVARMVELLPPSHPIVDEALRELE